MGVIHAEGGDVSHTTNCRYQTDKNPQTHWKGRSEEGTHGTYLPLDETWKRPGSGRNRGWTMPS